MNCEVYIVDDHKIFRNGLKQLVELYCQEFKIVKDFASGEELLPVLASGKLPDLLILDIELKGINGFEVAAYLQKNYPQIPILVLSMVEEEISILRMLKLGVKGYLPKDIEIGDLEVAVKDILNKGFHYTDKVTGKLIRIVSSDSPEYPMLQLSDREKDFLKLACSDLTYKEIADLMHVSVKSIDSYRAALFEKFSVKSRVGLTLNAVKYRLVSF